MVAQKIKSSNILIKFNDLLPMEEWKTIEKVSVTFRDIKFIKLLCFGCKKYCRRYSLRVVFKDSNVKYLQLSHSDKDFIKSHVVSFNWLIKDMQDVSHCFPV